jgi:hypothetical protein
MTVYQIEVPDETWSQWKRTVPRDRKLNDRIVALIEEDIDNAD